MFKVIMLILHTVFDFIVPTPKLLNGVEDKTKRIVIYAIKCFLLSMLVFVFIDRKNWQNVVLSIGLIVLIHAISSAINILIKQYLAHKKTKKVWNLVLFIADQTLILGLILFIAQGTLIDPNGITKAVVGAVFVNQPLNVNHIKALFIVSYIALSGAYIVPLFFDVIYEKVDNYADKINGLIKGQINSNDYPIIDEVKTGRWIGVLERILILIALFANQISSIGFIIAIKSLARFKMMENKIFSEYYLMGTLLSIAYTLVLYGVFIFIL